MPHPPERLGPAQQDGALGIVQERLLEQGAGAAVFVRSGSIFENP